MATNGRTWARRCAAAGLLGCLAGAGVADVGASPPQDVTIETVVSYVPTESFEWSASGAISDAGTFEFTSAHFGGIPSPAVGALQIQMTLSGADGTLDLRAELVVTATDEPGIFDFDGPWSVVGGTGAYEGARGTGKVHVTGRVDQESTPDDPELGTFTGRIHLH
jgi:hypothetical protein